MKSTNAGNRAPAGFWWNRKEWQIVVLSGDGGTLPGEPGAAFVRVPLLAMLVAAPILGALYVVFLPFLGLAMLAGYLVRRTAGSAKAAGSELAAVVGSDWRAGEAWFARRPKGDAKKSEPPAEPKK